MNNGCRVLECPTYIVLLIQSARFSERQSIVGPTYPVTPSWLLHWLYSTPAHLALTLAVQYPRPSGSYTGCTVPPPIWLLHWLYSTPAHLALTLVVQYPRPSGSSTGCTVPPAHLALTLVVQYPPPIWLLRWLYSTPAHLALPLAVQYPRPSGPYTDCTVPPPPPIWLFHWLYSTPRSSGYSTGCMRTSNLFTVEFVGCNLSNYIMCVVISCHTDHLLHVCGPLMFLIP